MPIDDSTSRDVILRVWRSGESAYRSDIEETDLVADNTDEQPATIRSVVGCFVLTRYVVH